MTKGDRLGALVAAIAGAAFGLHRLVDPDLPQQIAVGRAILSGSTPIGVSTFVFPFPNAPYVEDKWLTSVVVAAIDRVGGTTGLMGWQIGLAALVAVSWFVLLRISGARSGSAVAGMALLLVAGAYRLEPRPDTLSHALLAGIVVAAAGGLPWRHLRWALPATIGVWIQFHGYFVNGFLVVAAAIAAGIAGDGRGAIADIGPRSALSRGALVLVLAAAACLTHPQGWRALVWPVEQLRVLSSEPALRSMLTEFTPTRALLDGAGAASLALLLGAPLAGAVLAWRGAVAPLRGAVVLAFLIAIALVPPAAAAAWPYRVSLALAVAAWVEAPSSWREGRRFEGVLLAGFTLLAVPMIRNLALVPPLAAMLVVPAVQAAWDRMRVRREVGVAVVLGVLMVAVGARLTDRLPPGTSRAPGWTGWGWDADRFPMAAAAYVAGTDAPGELLNNFDTSGWLLRELHPARRVFISDNTSMYPASFVKEYRERIVAGLDGPDALHARFGVTTAILDHAAMETPALVARLSREATWRLVFLDRAAAVWIRDPRGERERVDLDQAQSALAASAPPSRGPLPGSTRRLFPELNLGIFLRAAGRPDLALLEADRMWAEGAEPEIATFAAASAEEAGRLVDQVDRLEQAFGRFGAGRSVDRWLARARFVRGVEHAQAGKLDEARADLERSASLVPDARGTSLALATVEARAGREDRALEHLRRALAPGAEAALRRAAESDEALAPLLSRLPSN